MIRLLLVIGIGCSSLLAQSQSWSYLGAGCIEPSVDALSSAGSEDLDFLQDGTAVVSMFRQSGFETTGKVYQYNGSSWDQVGPDLPDEGTTSAIDLETHGSDIYVSVLYAATQIRVYHYNGSVWEQLGETISGNLAYDFITDQEGNLFVFNTLDQKVRKFNGSSWETVLSLTEGSSPFWGGDQTVVCDEDNVFYYVQPFLNLTTFVFENSVYAFDGSGVTPIGDLLFSGLGTPGKLAFNNAGVLHGQYISDGTNKISRLEGSSWTQLLDTTNAANGIFGFNYTFNSADDLILSVFTNMYDAEGYTPLPALGNSGIAIAINNMVVAPNGKLHISFGEICDSGSNFSVMVLEGAVAIEDIQSANIHLFPNPSSGSIHVTNVQAGDAIFIYDMQGHLVFEAIQNQDDLFTINHLFAPGNYCLVLKHDNQVQTQLFQTN